MEGFPDYFYSINLFSITLRLVLATLLGGIIGLERGANKHTAGFRTHILVCLGATVSMLVNQYVYEYIAAISDPTRLGAQVITGVGFLGVGTILVTGRHKIKGLTTAAGLWAAACVGLAIGIGFYACAIITGILMLFCLACLPKVESYFYRRSRIMDLYIEIDTLHKVKSFLAFIRSLDVIVYETHLSPSEMIASGVGFQISIKIPKHLEHEELIEQLSEMEGILLVEEI